ncbi:type III secretion system chaperone [Acanthopleuribacter pedis]|uniref:Type III secretion system chaperone n=1 Tax=Acanthopleuribacter pedis TaxID=442870 RepID=A0A8J7QCF3_9BACT|nr:type III secretion system chaperone [Acanthopleuribacter pedis]MBO1321199.1 type III secretion system chaperone [Acanthopleuribacter pedis]
MTQPSKEQSTVSGFLKPLGYTLGIADLSLDDHGLCVLDVEGTGRVHIEVPPISEHCFIAAPVTFVPMDGEARNQILTQAMRLNFFGRGTELTTLSLDPDSDILNVHASLPVKDLDARQLENVFHNMVDLIGTIRPKFEQRNEPAEQAPRQTARMAANSEVTPFASHSRHAGFA